MRMTRIPMCLLLAAALALTACAQKNAKTIGRLVTRPSEIRLVDANYRAANTMAEALEDALGQADGIIITDFVYLGDPKQESTLSKLIPEQISSRLAQRGFRPMTREIADADIVQAKAEADPAKAKAGTDPAKADDEVDPAKVIVDGKARLVGSYTTAYDVLYVNARIIRIKDSAVLAGYDYEIPANASLRSLIPGVWSQSGIEPTVKTSFTTAAR